VSNPASPARLAGNRIQVADWEKGLKVSYMLPNVQQMMRAADGTLGTPYTIEVATNLAAPLAWTRIFTTNSAVLPFEFTDCEVRCATHPQKFYRVRQP
jgi:hypothetical protein